MARKKSSRRRQASQNLPLLAVSVGVIFFILELFLLFYASAAVGEFVGLFTALWLLGGVLFAIGVVAIIRESRWALLLLSGPAIALLCFIILALLSGAGYIFIDLLAT